MAPLRTTKEALCNQHNYFFKNEPRQAIKGLTGRIQPVDSRPNRKVGRLSLKQSELLKSIKRSLGVLDGNHRLQPIHLLQ